MAADLEERALLICIKHGILDNPEREKPIMDRAARAIERSFGKFKNPVTLIGDPLIVDEDAEGHEGLQEPHTERTVVQNFRSNDG